MSKIPHPMISFIQCFRCCSLLNFKKPGAVILQTKIAKGIFAKKKTLEDLKLGPDVRFHKIICKTFWRVGFCQVLLGYVGMSHDLINGFDKLFHKVLSWPFHGAVLLGKNWVGRSCWESFLENTMLGGCLAANNLQKWSQRG